MKIITHAPMLGIFVGLLSSLAIFERVDTWVFFIFAPLILLAISLCTYQRKIRNSWLIFSFMILVTLLCLLRFNYVLKKAPAEIKTFHDSEGVITNIRTWGRIYAATIDSEGGRYVFFMPYRKFVEGMRLKFNGVSDYFRADRANFSESKFWKARGVDARITIIEHELLPIKFSIYRLRFLISRFMRKNLPELTSSYLRAAWLGERDRNLNLKHQKWGTSHLLAVSGFHVGIIILCVSKIFGRRNNLIISIFLWTYIFLTGASPSAMRAGLMIQTAIFSRILGRTLNGVNTVSTAGVILLIESPFLFWDIGWRLSIIAAMTITALAKIEFSRKYLFLILSPCVALTTFAQVTYTFGKMPSVGLILNLIAPFYFSIAFSVASVGALFEFLGINFYGLFTMIIENGFYTWEKFADFMTSIFNYEIKWDFYISIFGALFLIFIVGISLKIPKKRAFPIALALTFLSFAVLR